MSIGKKPYLENWVVIGRESPIRRILKGIVRNFNCFLNTPIQCLATSDQQMQVPPAEFVDHYHRDETSTRPGLGHSQTAEIQVRLV